MHPYLLAGPGVCNHQTAVHRDPEVPIGMLEVLARFESCGWFWGFGMHACFWMIMVIHSHWNMEPGPP
jgi:hypothetical protein